MPSVHGKILCSDCGWLGRADNLKRHRAAKHPPETAGIVPDFPENEKFDWLLTPEVREAKEQVKALLWEYNVNETYLKERIDQGKLYHVIYNKTHEEALKKVVVPINDQLCECQYEGETHIDHGHYISTDCRDIRTITKHAGKGWGRRRTIRDYVHLLRTVAYIQQEKGSRPRAVEGRVHNHVYHSYRKPMTRPMTTPQLQAIMSEFKRNDLVQELEIDYLTKKAAKDKRSRTYHNWQLKKQGKCPKNVTRKCKYCKDPVEEEMETVETEGVYKPWR